MDQVNNMLAILYNNRASCNQNICDYKQCISDCDIGIELLSEASLPNSDLNLKLLWKKACALEHIERYADAFKAYESLMRIDSKFKNVQMNYNRVRNLLNETGKLKDLRNTAPASTTTTTTPKQSKTENKTC